MVKIVIGKMYGLIANPTRHINLFSKFCKSLQRVKDPHARYHMFSTSSTWATTLV
jgi:hypothetical protein